MSFRLLMAIGVALLAGWRVVPTADQHLASQALFAAAVMMTGWILVRERRTRTRRVLILGGGPLASTLIDEIASCDTHPFVVVGVVDDERPDQHSVPESLWLGTCDQLAQIVERVRPERIVLAYSDRRARLPLQSLLESRVRGVAVDDGLDFYERLTGQVAIETVRPSAFILAEGFRNHGGSAMAARVVSVVGSVVGLILTAPLLAAAALAVKLDSDGPVLFVSERAGRGGRSFGLLKFRTMHPCDEERSEWVLDNADRITRVGKWLRRFRIDELPQFVNVLRGDMNLIGPRPHPTSNHALFMEHIAYYSLRSTVHPGVTGWAQVRHGYANNLAEETEKMRYDLYYIKNRTLALDIRILFETVGCVVMGRGASEVRRPGWRRNVPLRPSPPLLAGQQVAEHHAGRQ